MRYVHILLIVIFVAVVGTFSLQNLTSVTVSFLNFSVTAPLAMLVAIIYVLGMISGGSVVSSVRHSLHRATSPAVKRDDPAKA